MVPSVAVMVVVPGVKPVACPQDHQALLTSATVRSLEFQVTNHVMLNVLPSSKSPIAVKLTFWPGATVATSGVTVMPVRVTALTVRFVLPMVPMYCTLIVVAPALSVVSQPFEPFALLTAARLLSPTDQLAKSVMSKVVPSVKIAVARIERP